MAYNNGFPMGYQQYYPQYPQAQQQPAQTPPTQNTNNIIWVSGEAGAKSYLVAPNTTVQLWDSEAQTIYLKSADASGMPSIKILDYAIRQNAPQTPVNGVMASEGINTYAEDIKALQGQIDAIKDELKAIKKPAGGKDKKES